MKKLLALLLVAVMLMSFVACGDNSSKPPVGPSDDTQGPAADGTGTPDEGNTPADTDAPKDDEPEVYVPDMDAKYGGMIGVGTETGVAYFDNLKVVSKQSNKLGLVDEKLEGGALPTLTYGVSVGGGWDKDAADFSLAVDPAEEYDEEDTEEDKNHVIAYTGDGTGAMAYMGEAQWNYYQYSLKVLPADENTVINLYFCIQDEQNYFVLSLGENGNTKADCYQVINGEKKSAAFKINNALALDAWTAVGITVDREIIDIYIGGALKFSVFNPDFVNQYHEYNGDVIPASISAVGYGAPGENLQYYSVAPENVIHDGKGTWGNSLSMIATMVFDMDIATAYDCDEAGEYENAEDATCGIPGDGTFATSYVGAYFADGVKLSYIRYSPRSGYASRITTASVFEGSEDGVNWTTIAEVTLVPAEGDFGVVAVTDTETAFKYVRYVSPSGCYGNIAEIEFWGPAN